MIKYKVEAEQVGCALIGDIIPSYEVTLVDDKTASEVLQELLAYQTGANPVLFGGVEAVLDSDPVTLKIVWDNIWSACLALRDAVGGLLFVVCDPDDPLIRKIWLWTTKGENKGQQVRYRKNMLGVTRDTDYTGHITKLYPIGTNNLVLSSALVVKEVAVKSADVTFGYLTLGGLYACYKAWTALADPLPAGMLIYELGYGWLSPTGFVDGSGHWQNHALAYDGNLATAAQTINPWPSYSWCGWLEFTHAVFSCSKVRWCGVGDEVECEVQAYYAGAWNPIYLGVPATGTWVTYEFSPAVNLEAIQIRYRWTSPLTNAKFYIYEVEFYGEGGVLDVSANWHQGADERTLRCLIADYDPTKTYGITYYHADYLLAWDVLGVYGILNGLKKYPIAVVSILRAKAQVELDDLKYPRITYEVRAVDLACLGWNFDKLQLGSRIKVIDEELNIVTDVNIVKLRKPNLDTPLAIELDIASQIKDVSDALISLSSDVAGLI